MKKGQCTVMHIVPVTKRFNVSLSSLRVKKLYQLICPRAILAVIHKVNYYNYFFFLGNSGDLRLFKCYLEMALPSSRFDFLMSEINQVESSLLSVIILK